MTISATTRICAVIGDPVEHSLSPQIHNAAFDSLGLDYAYVAFHVKRGDAGGAVRAARSLGIRGLSVTIPHKVDVIPHLDEVDPVTRHIGSVNTIVNEDGRLVGYSTDGPGALRALAASDAEFGGRPILLVGSGGAARAIAFSLAAADPTLRLTILGIDAAELSGLAKDLAEKGGCRVEAQPFGEDTLARAMGEAELVIHATPVGMAPRSDDTLIPGRLVRPEQTVFDAVYTPLETRLLREAAAAGARTVAGVGMFVEQAAIQFELWTGETAPVELMTRTVTNALAGGG